MELSTSPENTKEGEQAVFKLSARSEFPALAQCLLPDQMAASPRGGTRAASKSKHCQPISIANITCCQQASCRECCQ